MFDGFLVGCRSFGRCLWIVVNSDVLFPGEYSNVRSSSCGGPSSTVSSCVFVAVVSCAVVILVISRLVGLILVME